jgi:hypothetical protein
VGYSRSSPALPLRFTPSHTVAGFSHRVESLFPSLTCSVAGHSQRATFSFRQGVKPSVGFCRILLSDEVLASPQLSSLRSTCTSPGQFPSLTFLLPTLCALPSSQSPSACRALLELQSTSASLIILSLLVALEVRRVWFLFDVPGRHTH